MLLPDAVVRFAEIFEQPAAGPAGLLALRELGLVVRVPLFLVTPVPRGQVGIAVLPLVRHRALHDASLPFSILRSLTHDASPSRVGEDFRMTIGRPPFHQSPSTTMIANINYFVNTKSITFLPKIKQIS